MTKEAITNGNDAMVQNKGGNSMLLENKEVRFHCLHCNAVLTKKNAKYCNRACYNAGRKAGAKTPIKESTQTPVTVDVIVDVEKAQASVNSGVANDRVAFEKALKNMQHFKSALTLNRLKKLIVIAGDRALVVRVAGGLAIHWHIVGDECYVIYYAPGRSVTYKLCDVKGLKGSIQRIGKHKAYKDAMHLTEYIELAKQMKGGE